MNAVGWLRAVLAGIGFLVALMTLRHSVDVHSENKRSDPDSPNVDWTGIASFSILSFATALAMLKGIHRPFQGFSVAYGVAYLLAGWSLTRHYRIPVVERLVQWLERRKAK